MEEEEVYEEIYEAYLNDDGDYEILYDEEDDCCNDCCQAAAANTMYTNMYNSMLPMMYMTYNYNMMTQPQQQQPQQNNMVPSVAAAAAETPRPLTEEGEQIQASSLPSAAASRKQSAATSVDSYSPVSFASTVPEQQVANEDDGKWSLGIACHWIKSMGLCRCQLRLSAYHKTTGYVAEAADQVIDFETPWVWPNYRYRRHVFGRTNQIFDGVEAKSDMLLVAKVYRDASDNKAMNVSYLVSNALPETYTLAGWTALPLVVPMAGEARRAAAFDGENMRKFQYNVGVHDLPLYRGPVPNVSDMPIEAHIRPQYERIKGIVIRISIKSGGGVNLMTSDESDTDEVDESAVKSKMWILANHPPAHQLEFTSNDGIDLYIDSARFLPDVTTIVRVIVRIVDRNYNKCTGEFDAFSSPTSPDCFHPNFDARFELRHVELPPTATIVMKFYTISRIHKQIVVLGYAFVNLFCVYKSTTQPAVERGMQISLNSGCHQVRLFCDEPDGSKPCSIELGSKYLRPLPAASVLIRIRKAPCDKSGFALSQSNVPHEKWIESGLLEPKPSYEARVYTSTSCEPSIGERQMMSTMSHRKQQQVLTVMQTLSGTTDSTSAVGWSKNALSSFGRNDQNILMDSTFVSIYDPVVGFQITVESAMNIPWTSFTFGAVSIAPPSAYFKGRPNEHFDKPKLLDKPDHDRSAKNPRWLNGGFRFTNRIMFAGLTVIVQLHELTVSQSYNSFVYDIRMQAWTAFKVFRFGYAAMEVLHLPLFYGEVPIKLLNEKLITVDNLPALFKDLSMRGELVPVDNAYLTVTCIDGRRTQELKWKSRFKTNDEYLLSGELPQREMAEGPSLISSLPQGVLRQDAILEMSQKYRDLFYDKLQLNYNE